MKRLLVIWFAITPLLLGAYCSVNVQPHVISEVQKRATAFAAGEYPDLIIADVLFVTPFMTPTATYNPTATTSFSTETATITTANSTPIVPTPLPDVPSDESTPDSNRENTPPPPSDNNPLPGGGTPPSTPPPNGGTPPPSTPPPPVGSTPPPTPKITPRPGGSATPNPGGGSATPTPNGGSITVEPPPPPTDTATSEPSTTPIIIITPTLIPTDSPTANPTLPDISFSQSTYQVQEGVGAAIITIILTGDISSVAQVTFNTQDDTAVQPFDYQSQSESLIFAKGQTQLTVTIPISDNQTDNADTQTVLLKLSNPSQANVVQDTAILEISDNDDPPTLQFIQNQFSVMENQTSLLTVTLSKPSGKFVAVGYEIINANANTALSGTDYQAFTIGSLGFAPDATGRTPTEITFTWSELINDSQAESQKSLQFRLLAPPTNATLGDPFTTTLTIVDDDAQ